MFVPSTKLLHLKNNQEGNMAIAFSLSLGLIATALAVSLDIASAISAKTKMQDALDTATLFASQNPESETVLEDAENLFLTNFSVSHLVTDIDLSFEFSGGSVLGSANASKSLFYGKILDQKSTDIAALTTVSYSAQTQDPPCIIALSSQRSPGILVNTGAEINTNGCEAHVHSSANPAFTTNPGVTWDVERTCIAGSRTLNNSGNNSGIETNCEVQADPYLGQFPVPDSDSCDRYDRDYKSARLTLNPGVYCGWHNFMNNNARITFEPGVYVIKNGGWSVNGGDWEGDGVTFYFADTSQIYFNDGVEADFSAPTSGDYKDVFITEAPNLPPSQFILNDSQGFVFDGIMYLPSRQITFNNGANTDLRNMNLVADSFIFNEASLNLGALSSQKQDGSSLSMSAPYISK